MNRIPLTQQTDDAFTRAHAEYLHTGTHTTESLEAIEECGFSIIDTNETEEPYGP